jgi:hypothetical protein
MAVLIGVRADVTLLSAANSSESALTLRASIVDKTEVAE